MDEVDLPGEQRGRAHEGAQEESEQREPGHPGAGLKLHELGVPLDDRGIEAHLVLPSADAPEDLSTSPTLKGALTHLLTTSASMWLQKAEKRESEPVNNKKILRRIAPVAAALVLGGGVGAAVYAGVGGGSGATTTTTVAATSTVQPAVRTTTVSSLTQLYKTVTPGVVDITVTSTSSGNGFGSQQTQAEGTGFVYDTKGDILTAAHVVDGASTIKVHFQDGKTATATLVGKDDSTDTAVIKVSVDSSELHPLTMGLVRVRAAGPGGRRHRQPVRAHRDHDRRHRQRDRPDDHGAEQLLHLGRHPDGRADQPRQLRRPAARHERQGRSASTSRSTATRTAARASASRRRSTPSRTSPTRSSRAARCSTPTSASR